MSHKDQAEALLTSYGHQVTLFGEWQRRIEDGEEPPRDPGPALHAQQQMLALAQIHALLAIADSLSYMESMNRGWQG